MPARRKLGFARFPRLGARARARRHATDPDQADLRAFDRSRIGAEVLRRHVATLSGWRRSVRHPDDYERAAAYIEGAWAGLGLDVRSQAFAGEGWTARNLRVRLGPPSGKPLVVGAHYDACWLEGGEYPGADDNASGVAILLELGRVLREATLTAPVELVAFANEEPPFFGGPSMGSAVHAAALAEAGTGVRGMLALESLGYFTDAEGSQQAPVGLRHMTPPRGDFVAVVSDLRGRRLVRDVADLVAENGFPAEGVAAPAFVGGIDLSDHRSYAAHGWPACMLTDTAVFRNPHYHTASDTPDTLDYPRMARLAEAIARTVPML